MRLVRAILILSIILTCSCSITSMRVHPTLADELQRIEKVVIIPPAVSIKAKTLTGEDYHLVDEEQIVAKKLTAIAKRKLQDSGYQVVDFDFEALTSKDEDFALLVNNIREEFNRLKTEIQYGKFISTHKARQFHVSVGETINVIAYKSLADAVLLINHTGYKSSDAKVAKEIATSILLQNLTSDAIQSTGGTTEAALIDGTTGDLLWTDFRDKVLWFDNTDQFLDSMPDDVDVTEGTTAPQDTTAAEPIVDTEESAQSDSQVNTSEVIATLN